MIVLMEVETFRPHLDELFEDLLLRHVSEDDMLRIGRKDSEAIWNS